MKDQNQAKDQLMNELAGARKPLDRLRQPEAGKKIYQKRLSASRDDYRSIFDTANDAFFVHDIETGDILDVNPKMCEMYGYTLEEARRLNVEALSSGEAPYTQENALELIRKAAKGEPQVFEWMAKDKSGRLFWVEVSLKPTVIGSRDCMLAIVHDITDRKQAEEALREERKKAQKYFDIAGVMLVVIGADKKVNLINKKGCEVLGYKEEEIIGKNWFDTFIPEKVRKDTKAVFQKLIAGEVEPAEYFENPVLTKSGEERFVAWHNTVLTDETGNITGSLSSGEDITERKLAENALREARDHLEIKVLERTEELRKKNEELESFTYSVSHDLQAPLRTIQSLCQTLIGKPEERPENKHLEELLTMRQAAENMSRLLGDMLTYARLGMQSFSRTDVSLKSVLIDAQFELIEDIKKSGAEIRISDPLPVVRGHERTLVRLLANLLSNAIKFVPPGRRPEIDIEATHSENLVRVSLRDNGIGIAPEFKERIFRMFERLHSPGKYQGTGIGLAIVKKAVELHGGRIGVESERGKSSTFWFEIPD